MPRPKGSKNKKTAVVIESVESIDERIAATESAISTLTEELKVKKAELKELNKTKAKAQRIAEERKAEEEKSRIMEALATSGKSLDEVLEFLKN